MVSAALANQMIESAQGHLIRHDESDPEEEEEEEEGSGH
jgi:hypothetical protein